MFLVVLSEGSGFIVEGRIVDSWDMLGADQVVEVGGQSLKFVSLLLLGLQVQSDLLLLLVLPGHLGHLDVLRSASAGVKGKEPPLNGWRNGWIPFA